MKSVFDENADAVIAECDRHRLVSLLSMMNRNGCQFNEDLAAATWLKAADAETAFNVGFNKLVKMYRKFTGKEKSKEDLDRKAIDSFQKSADRSLKVAEENAEYLKKITQEYDERNEIPKADVDRTLKIVSSFIEKMPIPVSDSGTVKMIRNEMQRKILGDENLKVRILEIILADKVLLADKIATIYVILVGAIYFDWEKHAAPAVARGKRVS